MFWIAFGNGNLGGSVVKNVKGLVGRDFPFMK